MRSLVRRVGILILALALGTVGAFATNAKSQAAPPDPQPAALVVDCEHSTPGGLAVARAHGLCGGTPGGGVSTDNTVYGNCGSATLFIFNVGFGSAQWYESVNSSLGPIAFLNYGVSWTNWNVLTGGGFSGTAWPFSSFWNNWSGPYFTWAGLVTTVMSGSVTLVNGIQCTILNPTDYVTVTQ